jgi:hypothetical protein
MEVRISIRIEVRMRMRMKSVPRINNCIKRKGKEIKQRED